MFIEETYEQHLIDTLKAAKNDATPLAVKSIKAIDDVDITIENFPSYAKIAPAVIVGVMDDEVLNANNALGDSQTLSYDVRIFLLVQNKSKRGAINATARPILRKLKDTLRGKRFTTALGATENTGILYYAGRQLIAAVGGIGLYLQSYELHTLDTNDTRRTV